MDIKRARSYIKMYIEDLHDNDEISSYVLEGVVSVGKLKRMKLSEDQLIELAEDIRYQMNQEIGNF